MLFADQSFLFCIIKYSLNKVEKLKVERGPETSLFFFIRIGRHLYFLCLSNHALKSYDPIKIYSGAPAARRAAKRSATSIPYMEIEGNPWIDFLIVIMASKFDQCAFASFRTKNLTKSCVKLTNKKTNKQNQPYQTANHCNISTVSYQ